MKKTFFLAICLYTIHTQTSNDFNLEEKAFEYCKEIKNKFYLQTTDLKRKFWDEQSQAGKAITGGATAATLILVFIKNIPARLLTASCLANILYPNFEKYMGNFKNNKIEN